MINVRTHGHSYDTENKPITGRMQVLSYADSDTFWRHKPSLSFWLWLEQYLVTMDPNFGILFPSNFVPWLLTHFAGNNIDISESNLDSENISPRAEQMNLQPSINLSLHTCPTGHAVNTTAGKAVWVFVSGGL